VLIFSRQGRGIKTDFFQKICISVLRFSICVSSLGGIPPLARITLEKLYLCWTTRPISAFSLLLLPPFYRQYSNEPLPDPILVSAEPQHLVIKCSFRPRRLVHNGVRDGLIPVRRCCARVLPVEVLPRGECPALANSSIICTLEHDIVIQELCRILAAIMGSNVPQILFSFGEG
jgi:hypothetical protein